MKVTNSQKTRQYELTHKERDALRAFESAIVVEKLNVYSANVALEAAQSQVRAALSRVDQAAAQYEAAVAFLGRSQGMTNWQIAPDGARIEGQVNDDQKEKKA